MSHWSHASLEYLIHFHMGLFVSSPLIINSEAQPQGSLLVWVSDMSLFPENSPKLFVFSHCEIFYPVLYWHFQPVFGRLLNIRIILLYNSQKNISIKLVLLHFINIIFLKREKLPRLILNFSMSLPSHGYRILYLFVKLLLIWNNIK